MFKNDSYLLQPCFLSNGQNPIKLGSDKLPDTSSNTKLSILIFHDKHCTEDIKPIFTYF